MSARKAREHPILTQLRAEPTIKANRRSVPIEHSPLHSAAPFSNCNPRECGKQRLACALAALLTQHEQIFHIERRPGHKSRIGEEIKREANSSLSARANLRFEVRPRAESMMSQPFCIRTKFICQALVLRQRANQFQNRGNISSRTWANPQN